MFKLPAVSVPWRGGSSVSGKTHVAICIKITKWARTDVEPKKFSKIIHSLSLKKRAHEIPSCTSHKSSMLGFLRFWRFRLLPINTIFKLAWGDSIWWWLATSLKVVVSWANIWQSFTSKGWSIKSCKSLEEEICQTGSFFTLTFFLVWWLSIKRRWHNPAQPYFCHKKGTVRLNPNLRQAKSRSSSFVLI